MITLLHREKTLVQKSPADHEKEQGQLRRNNQHWAMKMRNLENKQDLGFDESWVTRVGSNVAEDGPLFNLITDPTLEMHTYIPSIYWKLRSKNNNNMNYCGMHALDVHMIDEITS